MTKITREQFEAFVSAAREAICRGTIGDYQQMLATLGITITDPAPPAAMVKLARDAEEVWDGEISVHCLNVYETGYLAALQHAAKVVRDAPYITTPPGPVVDLYHILRQLGAE